MDLTKQVVPVAFLGVIITGTYLVVGFQRDTARAIADSRSESTAHYQELSQKIEAIRDLASQQVTETAFDNWRLRFLIANRDKGLDVPEYRH